MQVGLRGRAEPVTPASQGPADAAGLFVSPGFCPSVSAPAPFIFSRRDAEGAGEVTWWVALCTPACHKPHRAGSGPGVPPGQSLPSAQRLILCFCYLQRRWTCGRLLAVLTTCAFSTPGRAAPWPWGAAGSPRVQAPARVEAVWLQGLSAELLRTTGAS